MGSVVPATDTLMERAGAAIAPVLKRTRKAEITDANFQRIFGIDMREMFKRLAEKFGYTIED